LIVISGPSGAGKSSVVGGLAEILPFEFSVSATTRAPRPHERDGVEYHFLDEATFQEWIDGGRFLEWAEYGGHRYGTPRQPVLDHIASGRDVLLDIEILGAEQVRAAHPAALLIFLQPPSPAELERRLRERGDTDEAAIRRRLDVVAEQMAAAPGLFDHLVVNEDLDTAIGTVAGILNAPNGSGDDSS
jgi:guanylate kinase